MKILILRLSALGDVIHGIPALNALKKIFPDSSIDWLVMDSCKELLEDQENINEIFTLKEKKLSAYFAIAKTLKAKNYDLIIDMQGLMKTALIAFLSKSSRTKVAGFEEPREWLAAYAYNFKADVGKTLDNSLHIIEKNLTLIWQAAFSFAERNPDIGFRGLDAIEDLEEFIENYGVDYGELAGSQSLELAKTEHASDPSEEKTKKVCIIPCTTWESKHWIKDYWSNLVTTFVYNWGATVYMLGANSDNDYIEGIRSAVNPEVVNGENLINMAGAKSLRDLPEFFRDMDLVVGVDTGPLHLAAASVDVSKTKIIGLYGPTSASRTGPYGFDALSYDEISGNDATNKKTIKKDGFSMSAIMVADVFRKAQNLL